MNEKEQTNKLFKSLHLVQEQLRVLTVKVEVVTIHAIIEYYDYSRYVINILCLGS